MPGASTASDSYTAAGGVAFYMHDLSGGGVERMRLLLIEELRGRGKHVVLVVQSDSGPLKAILPRDLPLVVLGSRSTWAAIPALMRFLRARRPDVLVTSLDHNNIAALVAKRLGGTATRLVICQHNALSAEAALGWKYRLVPFLYRILHGQTDGIVAVSNGVADDLAEVAGIARSRITTIYNPVIDSHFQERAAGEGSIPWLRDRSCPVLVFAGRLSPQKDPLTLLEAVAALKDAMPIKLVIIGDGPLRARLDEAVRRLGLSGSVLFTGFQSNPLPFIAQASALVLSSRYEGLGNVLVEALACGTPVVATDCPWGPAEILADGRFGVLAPPGDPLALSSAIRQCLKTSWDKALLRERGLSFSAAACADRHLALFEAIAAAQGNPKQRRIFGMILSDQSAAQAVETMFATPADAVNLVVTPNIDHLRQLRSPGFAEAYASAKLCCPDGMPILLYARLRGLRLKARVTGCEIFQRLAAHPALASQRLFVVAESQETAHAVAGWAKRLGLCDRVQAAVAQGGLLHDEQAQRDLAAAIAAHAPSILVLTLGAPTSEIFIHRNRPVLPRCWALCIGQAVRVELGLARRAPSGWQRLGVEWLWRMLQEPQRLAGRYARSALWLPAAIAGDLLAWKTWQRIGPPAENATAQDTSTAS